MKISNKFLGGLLVFAVLLYLGVNWSIDPRLDCFEKVDREMAKQVNQETDAYYTRIKAEGKDVDVDEVLTILTPHVNELARMRRLYDAGLMPDGSVPPLHLPRKLFRWF